MSIRRFAKICGPLAGLALGLGLATGAAAQSYGSAPDMPNMRPDMSMPAAPRLPGTPSLPGAPDMRPVWQGSAAPMMPDARTRDAWMDECHRRTAMYYGGHRKRSRHHDDSRRDDHGPSYCEAYFEDYYRTYAQRSHGYGMQMHPMPVMMQTRQPECHEVVTTEYVPIRTRVIPRRPAPRRIVPDKRVRDKRLLAD